MLRSVLSVASPAGARASLSILIFHRVHATPDPLFPEEIDAERFRRICQWVGRWCNVLPLSEAIERMYRHELPAAATALTFDDGYADNLTVAAPLLLENRLSCTFFIATGYLDGGRMWNDAIIESIRRTSLQQLDMRGLGLSVDRLNLDGVAARRSAIDRVIAHVKYQEPSARESLVRKMTERAEVVVPSGLMMTSTQVKALHTSGFAVGGHTVSHPILARVSKAMARDEIERGKQQLEQIVDCEVSLFAYPNGKPTLDYGTDAVNLVREAGFRAAVSTAWGVSTAATDRFQLARFTPWDRSRWGFGVRFARNTLLRVSH